VKASSIISLFWSDNSECCLLQETAVTFMGQNEKKTTLENGVMNGSYTMTMCKSHSCGSAVHLYCNTSSVTFCERSPVTTF
jgi:hypothetical protein